MKSTPNANLELKALSIGLGLGSLKTRGEARTAPAIRPDSTTSRVESTTAAQPMKVSETNANGFQLQPRREQKEKKRKIARQATPKNTLKNQKLNSLSWSRQILAYGLDFAFVVTAVCTALFTASFVSLFTTGKLERLSQNGKVDWSNLKSLPFSWTDLSAVHWLKGFSALEALAWIYGIFFAYVLLFRLMAGRTLGESVLAPARKRREGFADPKEEAYSGGPP